MTVVFRKKQTFCEQTPLEEKLNAATHGVGFVFSLFALLLLLKVSVQRGSGLHIASSSIYGGSLVLLYMFSTLYHTVKTEAKHVFRLLDHMSIYFLIFGTYVPLTLITLQGAVGWTLFSVEALLLLTGIVFKAVFGYRFPVISALFYLVMGWLAVFAVQPIVATLPLYGIFWLLLGGLFYTLGVLFFALDQKYHYFHAIWHLFVLAGSFSHFYLIVRYVL